MLSLLPHCYYHYCLQPCSACGCGLIVGVAIANIRSCGSYCALFSNIFNEMRQVLAPPSRGYLLAAKVMGATMWCWIFWRLKHDWADVFGHHASLEPPPLSVETSSSGSHHH